MMYPQIVQVILVSLFINCALFIQNGEAKPMTEPYEQTLEKALEHFYAANWDEARVLFAEMKKMHPEQPMAYFMEAMLPFWMYFFGGGESRHDDQFQQKSAIAIDVGKQFLNKVPADTNTILMMSGLFGYRSLVAANEGRYSQAMRSGIDGYSYTRQIMTMDTDNPNALIGQGVFQYMVGSVPSSLRWMASVAGVSGSVEEGFRLLELATATDSHVSIDAAMILSYLLIRESRYERAVEILSDLSDEFPDNMIFRFHLALALDKKGDELGALAAYRSVVNQSKQELPRLIEQSKDRLQVLTAGL